MFSLLSDNSLFQDREIYTPLSFYADKNTGGGSYVYMSSVDRVTADGGCIVDPKRMGTLTSTNDQAELLNYLNKQGTTTGTGCLARLGNEHTIEMNGGLPNIPTFDIHPALKNIG